jgi:Uma2 family endonuclease
MALPQAESLYTVAEYLAFERSADERHEYLDGYLYAMAGESLNHGTICTNLVIALGTQLRGTPCLLLSKDMKIRSSPLPQTPQFRKGLFSYPDLVMVCGEPLFHDTHRDVLLNPRVIIEVLSPSTEAFDRGGKFLRYQTWNPTLTDYVLVSQDAPILEHFIRRDDGSWSYYVHRGMERQVSIASVGCTLRLADVYDRIVFPADQDAVQDDESSSC